MKHRLATPYVLLSVSLLSTLAGCHVLVDEMIANSTISGATDKNASNANDSRNNSRNSNRRGGRVVRPNPSGEIPIINPISDGIGGGGGTPPPPPPVTTPPPCPPTCSPPAWTGGGGTPPAYRSTSSYAANAIVHKDGKYYKAKFGTTTDPTTATVSNAWERVNPDGTDYLRTGQGNATPYDSSTTYPVPPTGNYYVTHNNKLWRGNTTAGQILAGNIQAGNIPGSGIPTCGSSICWTEITAPTTPFPLKDSSGNTLGTIDGSAGNRVLTISSGTTIIRDNAFKNKNLDEVVIPPGVTAIGKGAFEGNTDLSSVTIPNSVTHIKENAFKTTNLSTVTIPNSVVSIGNGAFMDAELSSVTFSTPSSVTSIGDNAFRNTDLTSVTIPNSVISIGNGAFAGTSLTSVTFAPTSSVTSIGDDAFKNTDLTSVTIPIRVTSIGTGAFSGITTLTSVTISRTLLTATVRTSAFPSPTPPATITFKDHTGATIP